jgi:hypothetical protein
MELKSLSFPLANPVPSNALSPGIDGNPPAVIEGFLAQGLLWEKPK